MRDIAVCPTWQEEHVVQKKACNRPDKESMEQILAENKNTVEGLILRLAWKEGMSRDEIHQLMWQNISFPDRQIILSDRTIPMDDETQDCLQRRYDFCGVTSPYVIIGLRYRKQMAPESISRLARIALNKAGLTDISLVDLRRDFIIRQLETHDWPYAARISGLSRNTIYANFSRHVSPAPSKILSADRKKSSPFIDEFRLWKVLQEEGNSAVGLTLWLAWRMGLPLKEILNLTWDQVDLYQDVIHLKDQDISINNSTLWRLLRDTSKQRKNSLYPHVILSQKSQRPFDGPWLSKMVRSALIRGGLEDVTLQDLTRAGKHAREKMVILRYVEEHGAISRRNVVDLFGVQSLAAYEKLSRLVESRDLVLVGKKYYLNTAVPPEEQYTVIRTHLEDGHAAYRQEIAEILHIGIHPCSLLLRRLVHEGKLLQSGQKYSLPKDSALSN